MIKRLVFVIIPVCFFLVFLGVNLPNYRTNPHPKPILKSFVESPTDHANVILIDIGPSKSYLDYVPDKAYSPLELDLSRYSPLLTVYIFARPPPEVS